MASDEEVTFSDHERTLKLEKSIELALKRPWYVVENDIIGGFFISTHDKKLSEWEESDWDHEVIVCDSFFDAKVAHHVCELHNRSVRR